MRTMARFVFWSMVVLNAEAFSGALLMVFTRHFVGATFMFLQFLFLFNLMCEVRTWLRRNPA